MDNQRGFTFLEVLIALTILAVAGVGILVMINDSQRTLAQSRLMVAGSMLAREKLFELEHEGVTSITNRKGEFDGHPGLFWKARAYSTDYDNIFRLRLSVGSADGKEEYVVVDKAFRER